MGHAPFLVGHAPFLICSVRFWEIPAPHLVLRNMFMLPYFKEAYKIVGFIAEQTPEDTHVPHDAVHEVLLLNFFLRRCDWKWIGRKMEKIDFSPNGILWRFLINDTSLTELVLARQIADHRSRLAQLHVSVDNIRQLKKRRIQIDISWIAAMQNGF